MKKEYEALSVDVVKFEAQDVITVSSPNNTPNNTPNDPPKESIPDGSNPDSAGSMPEL